jgi:hypothetical protein
MISFDGTYRLHFKPKSHRSGQSSSHENAYAWRVRIIDLTISRPQVRHIKPWIVFARPASDDLFKSNCAESLGRNICRDFRLEVDRILWIEYFPETPEPVRIAVFTPHNHVGPGSGYTIQWRPARPNEFDILTAFLPEGEIETLEKFS